MQFILNSSSSFRARSDCPIVAPSFPLLTNFRSGAKFEREKRMKIPWWVVSFAYVALVAASSSQDPHLSSARVVFQTNYGDIEFGFFPSVAPQTVDHIFKLVRLGCYNTNHFFRVDKGFVAQVADVVGGRSAPMNEEQRKEAKKTVVGEFSDVKHVRGILSMGSFGTHIDTFRASVFDTVSDIAQEDASHGVDQFHPFQTKDNRMLDKIAVIVFSPSLGIAEVILDSQILEKFAQLFILGYSASWDVFIFEDPNSAQSSFSMLLGNAPHLDGQYAIFGKVTKGDDTLTKLEQLPTRKEGIFVMPTERITILSSYYYDTEMESCEEERSVLKRRLSASAVEIEKQNEMLPMTCSTRNDMIRWRCIEADAEFTICANMWTLRPHQSPE
ncbi:hypothetical protein POTOM_035296 [Populus tomentosa]|uniref:PPIase cyclophilin-type domain-containing protein n=1 Tax=Populus tomentosa TaxID=118781 RepID=A0A8X7YYL6_POPTO|nr:hypothetical protein POTOM_035296 [Populus tomentosa]